MCLAKKPHKDITVREVAARAGVNPAMIYYYFGSKEGLFIALVDFLFSTCETQLRALTTSLPQLDTSPSREFVKLVDECFYRRAPVLRLLTRELTKADSSIQANYYTRLASRITRPAAQFIAEAGRLGYYRTDLNLKYATLQLLLLTVHPIAIEPHMMEAAYGFGKDELFSAEWLSSVEADLDRLFRN